MASPINTEATSLEAQVAEVALALQAKEQEKSTDDLTFDNVQVSMDTDAAQMSVTITLPITTVVNAGIPSTPVAAYLTD